MICVWLRIPAACTIGFAPHNKIAYCRIGAKQFSRGDMIAYCYIFGAVTSELKLRKSGLVLWTLKSTDSSG
jgi:hypothetical protein